MNRNVGISILCNISYSISKRPCAGCRVVRIYLLRFLAGCHTRWLNQVLSVLYLSMLFIVLLIRAPFYVLLVFIGMCCVFRLCWLSCHYLPSDWLERLLWGSLNVARRLSSQSPGQRVFMIYDLVPSSMWYISYSCGTINRWPVCAKSAIKQQ